MYRGSQVESIQLHILRAFFTHFFCLFPFFISFFGYFCAVVIFDLSFKNLIRIGFLLDKYVQHCFDWCAITIKYLSNFVCMTPHVGLYFFYRKVWWFYFSTTIAFIHVHQTCNTWVNCLVQFVAGFFVSFSGCSFKLPIVKHNAYSTDLFFLS